MARGRMISNSISESRKFAALASHEHRLIYLMVLPWVDKSGRFEADPVIIKSKCLLRLDIELSTVQAWLKDAANVGLITVYEADGIPVLEIVDFLKHNTPHHKEPESQFPGPDESGPGGHEETASTAAPIKHESSMAQAQAEDAPTSPIIEVEVKEEVEVEEKEEHSSPDGSDVEPPARRPIPKRKKLKTSLTLEELVKKHPNLAVLVEVWHEHCGELSRWDRVDDDRLRKLEQLASQFGDSAGERLRDATLEVVNDPEQFYALRGYGLDNLLVKGRVLRRSDAWRNRERNQRRSAENDPLAQYRERGL